MCVCMLYLSLLVKRSVQGSWFLVNGNLHHITLTALIREIDLIALLSARLLLRLKINKRLVKSGAQSNQQREWSLLSLIQIIFARVVLVSTFELTLNQ